jgi:elongation factor G
MILLWLGVDPKTDADRENLVRGLEQLLADEPALAVQPGADGVVMLGADSEEQLERVVGRLAHEFNVEAGISRLEIAYKEALTRAAKGEAKYAVQAGGRGQYGHVKILVEPGQEDSGYVFTSEILNGTIPDAFIGAIDEGICDALDRGVVAGYPMDDVRVTLWDGSYHDVDSSQEAFREAARLAFYDAARRAQPVLLEPVMAATLVVPEEYAARVAALLSARHAVSLSRRGGNDWPIVAALLPLSDTFGLAGQVRERTAGRGLYHVRFARYAPVTLAGDDGDRDTPVREPKRPRTPPHVLRAAVPEPREDEW